MAARRVGRAGLNPPKNERRPMRRSHYRIVEDGPDVLCIEDLGPWDQYLTVTNDAENVVQELAPRLKDRTLEYIDSDGQRDRLLVANGKFAGFKPCGKASEE